MKHILTLGQSVMWGQAPWDGPAPYEQSPLNIAASLTAMLARVLGPWKDATAHTLAVPSTNTRDWVGRPTSPPGVNNLWCTFYANQDRSVNGVVDGHVSTALDGACAKNGPSGPNDPILPFVLPSYLALTGVAVPDLVLMDFGVNNS